MKLSTRYFTEAKDDYILKPCLSTSGQFIDMKNVIGHMRLAASSGFRYHPIVGLEVIFSGRKCSHQTQTVVEWYPLFRPSSILHLGLIPNYLGLFPQLLGLIPHSAII